jgi:hypothetical protein
MQFVSLHARFRSLVCTSRVFGRNAALRARVLPLSLVARRAAARHSQSPRPFCARTRARALLVCCALCDADCCNVCHISPYAVTEGILAGASRLLAPDGVLCVYGPFMVDGAHTAESNAAFDERLRSQDALWGVRCSTAIAQEADAIGLELVASEPMPANNFVLVFRRKGGPAAA